jgi:acetylornithine deacetylase/succinyl-diaminopimelate desuccinylase-like protein
MRTWALPLALVLIGGATVAGLRIYNDRTERELRSQLFIPRQAVITPEVELLRQYVRIDTSQRNEIDGARFLAALLAREGIRAEIIESAPGRANLYARIAGKRRGDGLLLLNHIDVVAAPPAGWKRPPFSSDILLNELYGRGTLDMKGIAVCELLAFIDIARTHRAPERDVVFLATADEENGGAMGVAWLLQHRPDVFDGVRYAINEGGITETTEAHISYFGIEIGTKMTVKARLRAPTREAMQALRIALEPETEPEDPLRLLPEVRDFLHDLAPMRVEQGQYLADVARTIDAGKFWLLAPGYRELLQNNVLAGPVERDGTGAAMLVSLFNLPDEQPGRRIEWLRGLATRFGVSIVDIPEQSGPAPLSARRTPLFEMIARESVQNYPGARAGSEVLAAWMNDSRYLRARGIEAYGLMPFPVDWYQTLGIHAVDERLRVDWFGQGVTLLRKLVMRYAFDPLPPAAVRQ